MNRTKILIVNDDGITSPLIKKLAYAATELGEVWVVAPDGQRSAVSQSSTFGRTISVSEYDIGIEGVKAYACSGTPADCMRLGILKIVPGRPDIALSGINNGPNISSDIQYSGTVGAAFEASFLGVPAIAVSQASEEGSEVTDRYLTELLKECIGKPLPRDLVWNINFPGCSLSECKGVMRDVKVATDHFYDDEYVVSSSDDKVTEYELKSQRIWKATPGTDLAAIIDNYVAVGTVHNVC